MWEDRKHYGGYIVCGDVFLLRGEAFVIGVLRAIVERSMGNATWREWPE